MKKKLFIYNTLSREKEKFKSNDKELVKMYSCGPTVYNNPHIGNLRSFMFSDLIHRVLKYCGYTVKTVTNITDVDDKTIKNSQLENKSLKEFTEKYTLAFFKDIKSLNILEANHYPKATEYVNKMLKIIDLLIKKKHAYVRDGSVYFKISSFKDYGQLNNLNFDDIDFEKGHRIDIDEYDKDNINDFVLWKAYQFSDGDVYWDSPYGKGRPGWHLECSTMSLDILGDNIDLHTGGVDLCFPHHENEIAQVQAITHKRFVNYWLHCNHLLINGQKMSKSLNNFYTLKDLQKKGFSNEAIRYTLISTHYRKSLNFTFEEVENAIKPIKKINHTVIHLKKHIQNLKNNKRHSTEYKKYFIPYIDKFEKNICDDLNTSAALASLFEISTLIYKKLDYLTYFDIQKLIEFFIEANAIFAVFNFEEDTQELPLHIEEILIKREKARNIKDFEASDKYRDLLAKEGYRLKDTPTGQEIERI